MSLSPSGATMAWFVRTPVGRLQWPSRADIHVFDTLTGARKDAALLDERKTVLVGTTFSGADARGSQDSGGNVALDVETGKECFQHIAGREDGHIVPSRNPIEGFRLLAVAPDGKSFYTFGTRSLRERRDMATGKLISRLAILKDKLRPRTKESRVCSRIRTSRPHVCASCAPWRSYF